MEKFLIVENKTKAGSGEVVERISNYLSSRNLSYKLVSTEDDKKSIPDGTDCIITIGGDGTLIHAAAESACCNIPLIGIKTGHLGYMAVQVDDVEALMDDLINDRYSISEYFTLAGNVDGIDIDCIMNEIIVGRKKINRTVRAKVSIDGEFLNEYSADGIIVANPTGSTAYNLSAGGPVVKPDCDVIIITPICGHISVANSIVVAGDSIVEIEIGDCDGSGPVAVYDSNGEILLKKGSKVTVRRGKYKIPLIRLKNETFISNLRKKLETI